MELTDEMIDNLTHLARLRFSGEERISVKKDLQKMISFVEKLQQIDTTGVKPLLHMSDTVNILREDIIQGSVSRQEALLNAPIKDEQFFKVPKVIKK